MQRGPKISTPKNHPTPAFKHYRTKHTKKAPVRSYLEIGQELVDYYNGSSFEYFKEYKASASADNTTLFSLGSCDPLPLEQVGDIKFFFTSAHTGNVDYWGGEPYQITDPEINQLAVVRGKGISNKAEIYIGFNKDDYKLVENGTKRIYSGNILYMKGKSIPHIEQMFQYTNPKCKHLNNQIIGLEVKKYLDPKDFNWNSPVFHQKINELFVNRDGAFWNPDNQMLSMRTCYWTKEENKLKGITYKSAQKSKPN